jgi:hypothetical protein
MRVNSFGYTGPSGGYRDKLPGPFAVALEDAVIQPQFPVEGKTLKAMGQVVRTGE